MSLHMKGMAHSSSKQAPPVRSRTTRFGLKQLAAKARANSKILISASDVCSTSHMKPEKFAKLTQLDAQDSRDTREDNARTAEVTICIIPEKTARSLSTVTVRQESQVVEDNVHCVTALGIECSAHCSPPQHSPRAHSSSSHAENFGQLDSNENRANRPVVTRGWGSRSRSAKGSARSKLSKHYPSEAVHTLYCSGTREVKPVASRAKKNPKFAHINSF